MSEAAIFAFGSVLFVITTWASIAYGLASMHQLRLADLEKSEHLEVRATGQFTELQGRTTDSVTSPNQPNIDEPKEHQ